MAPASLSAENLHPVTSGDVGKIRRIFADIGAAIGADRIKDHDHDQEKDK